MVFCVSDTTLLSVGATHKRIMFPRLMKTTSIADQLCLHTQMQSKVIVISLKDRGSILPAGHSTNASYGLESNDIGK